MTKNGIAESNSQDHWILGSVGFIYDLKRQRQAEQVIFTGPEPNRQRLAPLATGDRHQTLWMKIKQKSLDFPSVSPSNSISINLPLVGFHLDSRLALCNQGQFSSYEPELKVMLLILVSGKIVLIVKRTSARQDDDKKGSHTPAGTLIHAQSSISISAW
ncbi:uncharacterized protein BJ212DRAFT_1305200 [Suillus subaureus]|uniref:Uncharacterized protein n=1 Tax=Suillus subaureus TaxID=48587 RepID=A0A9P7DQK8_9AGAM|nr:uncharacterized protein BJ212DRAFT_1305200 [Suillus subaureus]KAG1800724.1 hypothetical protein BJ212DRAFT_1305200 [Suillus subaureus]